MPLALIVDDSKTSRHVLRKMLDKHQVEAQMVESAEEALEFLKHNRPDFIFMDHMMPGMDGFAAVKAIKADPVTSSIPIIMHTTKQGDIYVGQAKALGAVDILSKPASDQALIEVLERIKRKRVEQVAILKVQEHPQESEKVDAEPDVANTAGFVVESVAGGSAVVESIVVDRAIVDRVIADPLNEHPPSFWGTSRQWLLAVVWLLPVMWMLSLYYSDQAQLKQFEQQQSRWVDALEWSLNREQFYDYGELPLSGDRLDLLVGLLHKLQLAGFKGVVRVEGHVGEFCLTQISLEDGSAALMLPRSDLPLDACDMLGSSTVTAMARSIEKSPAFERFILERAGLYSDIKVEVAAYGASMPLYAYPKALSRVTAGDWNGVALNNNRVYFDLLPSTL